jgi:Predicted O-methyltransferase
MNTIEKIRADALERGIPIMKDDGISYLCSFIKEKSIKNVLEIGSAVGYSALCMAKENPEIKIVTIEVDNERYREAIENIQLLDNNAQIECLNMDAREYEPNINFDLVFIDAAKTLNKYFFDKFGESLSREGYIIIDNIYFYGLVDNIESIKKKRLRIMVEKIREFKEYVLKHPDYNATYLQCGDGIIVAQKKR